jgi:cytochrome b561
MMVFSIILADLDGTFAAVPATAPLIQRITPAILNVQAVIAGLAILFLIWSAWTQARRPSVSDLPVRNDKAQFGKASRGFHWVIAALMFCLVPIGLFMAVLPESALERVDFVSAHQSLGLTVLVLAIGRIGWLLISPKPEPLAGLNPWEQRVSRMVHIGLYCALLAFPISGYLVSQGESIDFYGWSIAPSDWSGAANIALLIHGWALPLLFYATVALHLSAVVKRHFGDRDKFAVRRMLR